MAKCKDPAFKSALLNLVVSEITRSSTNHIYDLLKSEMGSSRPDLLALLLEAATRETVVSPRRDNYETLLSSSESDFHSLFRMKRKTMKVVIGIIEKRLAASPDPVAASISVEKKVHLTCWLMGNVEHYSTAAEIFGVESDQVYPIFEDICSELCSLSGKYICWPSVSQCETITDAFEDKFGFPGVIGIIGYIHIKVKRPDSEAEAVQYLNDKIGLYTTVLQAVCDDKMLFCNVCVGFPGRCSPSRVLIGSPLYGRLTSRTDPLIKPRKHILGSNSYPQLATLLTPYNPEVSGCPLNEQQKKFNYLHEKARGVIDTCFAVLKARFCRLNYVDVPHPDLASKVILAACVLHNIALTNGDEFQVPSNIENCGGNSVNLNTNPDIEYLN